MIKDKRKTPTYESDAVQIANWDMLVAVSIYLFLNCVTETSGKAEMARKK